VILAKPHFSYKCHATVKKLGGRKIDRHGGGGNLVEKKRKKNPTAKKNLES
jgi:hypothetical protein